jgi:hypothetical protein
MDQIVMQPVGTYIPNTGTRNSSLTSRIWQVWKNSVKSEIVFTPISKTKARRLWFHARKWEQRTHQPGRHGGIIGSSALNVLYTLIHDYLNHKTGRLDPSVKAIASKASICERTCHTALQKLRSLGLIDWLRRCVADHDEEGRFVLRQATNAYRLTDPRQWLVPQDEEPPPPTKDTLGYPPPRPTTIESASLALQTGNRQQAYSDLTADTNDPLSQALAGLGRAMGAI